MPYNVLQADRKHCVKMSNNVLHADRKQCQRCHMMSYRQTENTVSKMSYDVLQADRKHCVRDVT